jgi:hypothetical protein
MAKKSATKAPLKNAPAKKVGAKSGGGRGNNPPKPKKK